MELGVGPMTVMWLTNAAGDLCLCIASAGAPQAVFEFRPTREELATWHEAIGRHMNGGLVVATVMPKLHILANGKS